MFIELKLIQYFILFSDSEGGSSKYRRVSSGRATHVSNSGTTESSASREAATDDESTSDGDVGVDLDVPDPLATESRDMDASDGSGSTSSNTSKRKKSGRGPGKVPETTAGGDRPVITPKGDS